MNAFLRLVAWALAIVLVTLPVVAVIQGWIGAERWPLRTLRVVGDLERVDAAKLRATVLPHAQRGFFAVRLEDAQIAVAKLPWVEQAEVRKQWPDVLIVKVVEHRPFAWWGEDRLLSERGRIFPGKGVKAPKTLPHFDGPESRSADLVALYNESRAMFAAEGLDVRVLRIDSRGSWSMTLSNGAELLIGRDDAKLRLARFARLLPQLAQQGRPLARADLRYTNGFALTWASGRERAAADKASAAAAERPFRGCCGCARDGSQYPYK
jgi:cell division protein FtsQ